MPDVTDSFCERCGARYAFSPPVPKSLSLKGRASWPRASELRFDDGQSMADSLTLARSEDEHEDSSRITEAFHRTFNFCMTCRQYACDNCWNIRVGACLSCAPRPAAPSHPKTTDRSDARRPMGHDWSIFPDGPAVEPVGRPARPRPSTLRSCSPTPSRRGRARGDRGTGYPRVAPHRLPFGGQTPSTPVNSRGNRRSASKSVDAEAASLWRSPTRSRLR